MYLALTVLKTKFVSNKKNNRSVQHDDKYNDNDVHNDVLNRLTQNCVFVCDDIGGQLTLPPPPISVIGTDQIFRLLLRIRAAINDIL